ncbi:MAG TPA: SDR family oxidoreductase [Gemmataceae bacterium]|jgi:NAD(P)-dependent dehydrogenase (short-subunit alcohol dehydrogenase family)
MPETRTVALVTGANRGIGREIVRQLAAKGVTVILAARDPAKAEDAAAEFVGQGLPVVGRPLDVTDPASVERLAASVASEFGQLDILINNAGVYLDADRTALTADLDAVQATLETNLFGAWRVAQAFAPLVRKSRHGRIVNLSSQMGQLASMTDGTPGYRVSKAALNALTRLLADDLKADGVLVNSACPGWVRTDMGGPNAPGTVEQGADTPVWLATLPDDGPSGWFFQNRKPIPW